MRPLPTLEEFETTRNVLQFMTAFIAKNPRDYDYSIRNAEGIHDAMVIAGNNMLADAADHADMKALCEPPKRVTRACDIQGHSDLFRHCAGAIIHDET